MTKDWVSVYSSDALHKAELLRHILQENGVEAIILNQQDSFYKSIGDVSVWVKREKVILAKKKS
jgi:hypothetical protein